MSRSCVDGPSKRYLQQISNEIGYFDKILNTKPASHILTEMGIGYIRIENLDIDCEGIATVFSVKTSEIENTDRWGATGECANCGENMYIVDWSVKNNDSEEYEHRTFVFSERPTEKTIIKAHQLNKIRCEIEGQFTEQHYACDVCNNKVHWTKLETPDWMGETTLEQQITLMKRGVCGCQAPNILDSNPDSISTEENNTNAVATQQDN